MHDRTLFHINKTPTVTSCIIGLTLNFTLTGCRRQENKTTVKDTIETPPRRNVSQISSSAFSTPQKSFYSQASVPSLCALQTPTKPRIAKLKSLFEKNLSPSHMKCHGKNKPSVCRSNSLGK